MGDNWGGQSQFAGGGFMPQNSQDGGGGAAPSPGQKKSFSDNQTLRAVTVKQLYDNTLNTPDDQYRVDGLPLQNVTLVGKLVSVQEQSTNLTIKLNDGTGNIEMKYWLDSDDDTLPEKKAAWQPGVYVRVYGALRSFGQQRNLLAFSIRPITDFNEVTYHNLRVVFEHLHLTKGAAAAGAAAANGMPKQEAPSSMQGGFNTGNGAAPAVNGGGGGGNAIQEAVANVLNQPDAQNNMDGLSLQEISERLGGRYPLAAIKAAADALSNDGLAFNGVDENHYRTTSC